MNFRRMFLICSCFASFCIWSVDPEDPTPAVPKPSPKHRSVIAHTPGDKIFDIAFMLETSDDMKNLESDRAYRGVQSWLRLFPDPDKEPDETETYFASYLCASEWQEVQQFSRRSPKSIGEKLIYTEGKVTEKPALNFADCFKGVRKDIFDEPEEGRPGRPNVPDVIIYLSICSESMTDPEMSKFIFMVICMPGLPGYGTKMGKWSKKVKIENARYFVYSDYDNFRRQLDKMIGVPIWILDCECAEYGKLKCEPWTSDKCSLVGKCVNVTQNGTHRLSRQCSGYRDEISIYTDSGWACDDDCQLVTQLTPPTSTIPSSTDYEIDSSGTQSTDFIITGICAFLVSVGFI